MKSEMLQSGLGTLTQTLTDVSAKIGRDPSLVQGGTGNTSVKLDGVMWIKASGQWLADAMRDDFLVPVDLAFVRDAVRRNSPLAIKRASIETAMHAVLPHRVVLHVHGVNTIAWAVRRDGEKIIGKRLAGLHWAWIPYVASGLPLACAVERALARDPKTDVLILANHGLVVCGGCCESAEALLRDVEWRLRLPVRSGREPRMAGSESWASKGWRLPDCEGLHALATDPISRSILAGGVLYPCQGIFLCPDPSGRVPFQMLEDRGVLLNESITPAEYAILVGLVQIVQRIEDASVVRYLTTEELSGVMNAEASSYREMAGHRSALT